MPVRRSDGYSVEAVDVQAAPDAQLRMVADLMRRLGREAIPEDPETPSQVLIGQMRGMPPIADARAFVARSR